MNYGQKIIENNKLHSKSDFQRLVLDILNPVKPFYSEQRAFLKLGDTSAHYDDRTAWMEAFSRPLWGLVPFWGGGGSEEEFEAIYLKGIKAGTDPEGAEYWGDCKDYDQMLVEMAAIAYGILMAPDKVWDPLNEREKDNLAFWLNFINQCECVENNWQFFCILVNTALASKGYPYSEERLKRGFDRIETYYMGNGWYRDGLKGSYDYYIGFAIHFYSLIYAKFMEEKDPDRAKLFKERAAAYARDFVYWFDETGASVVYGRSLTYRFAQVSFFSACLWADVGGMSVGVLKGLISRHLRDWVSSPIFDHAGILSIGYKYPNLHMCEDYNAPGSPYWSLKTFLFLDLPEEHPFWQAEAEPLPMLERIRYMKEPGMIVQHLGNHALIYLPGSQRPHQHHHLEAKYSKFVYSSRLGFNISISNKNIQETAGDNMLVFELGGQYFVRDIIDSYSLDGTSIISEWSPFPGIQVKTTLIPDDIGHKRIHEINSEYECKAYDGGFSIASDASDHFEAHAEAGTAKAENSKWKCTVQAFDDKGIGIVVKAAPNCNLVHSKVSFPALQYNISKGHNTIETYIEICQMNN